MTYTLSDLANDIRAVLQRGPAPEGADDLCALVGKALNDAAFVARHLPDRSEGKHPRQILYEDPDLGFCICGHVYDDEAIGQPHDHGPGWALYGQAAGSTEMTEWRIVDDGAETGRKRVVPDTTYEMRPGDARFYDVGVVHSPKRLAPTRLVRLESQNLDNVKRSDIEAA